jgi:hypothetical protein
VDFVDGPGSVKLSDLASYIDHAKQTVTSSTGELALDYSRGVLKVNAPRAQGICGALKAARATELQTLSISSDLEIGSILAVALDDQPLASSSRILLQVMSEEKATGFQTEPVNATLKRITNIGTDPWQVKVISGNVRLKRPDAAQLTVTALDFNGYPVEKLGLANNINLRPTTVYYLISR